MAVMYWNLGKHLMNWEKFGNKINNTLKNTIMGRYYNGDIEGKFWFGVQSSYAPSRFSASAECEQSTIEYFFDEENIDEVKEELQRIEEILGVNLQKIEEFFAERNGYADSELADAGITDSMISEYADYKLGKKIEECIEREGQCQFSAGL